MILFLKSSFLFFSFFFYFFFFSFFFFWLCNPGWVLVCSTVLFPSCLSSTFALQPTIFILFRSSSIWSFHLNLGLPSGLVLYGVHSVIYPMSITMKYSRFWKTSKSSKLMDLWVIYISGFSSQAVYIANTVLWHFSPSYKYRLATKKYECSYRHALWQRKAADTENKDDWTKWVPNFVNVRLVILYENAFK